MKLFLEVFATPRSVTRARGVREEVARSNASPATRENLMGRMQTALGQTATRMNARDIVSASRDTGRRTTANPVAQVRNTAGRTVPQTSTSARRPTPINRQTRAEAIDTAARSRAPMGDLSPQAQEARRNRQSARRNQTGGTAGRNR